MENFFHNLHFCRELIRGGKPQFFFILKIEMEVDEIAKTSSSVATYNRSSSKWYILEKNKDKLIEFLNDSIRSRDLTDEAIALILLWLEN